MRPLFLLPALLVLAACGNSAPACNTPSVKETLEEIDFKRLLAIVEDFEDNGVWVDREKVAMKLENVRTRSQKKNFTECAANLVFTAPIDEIRESTLFPSNPAINFTVVPQPRPDWSKDKWQEFLEQKLEQSISYTIERDDDGRNSEIVITGRLRKP